MKEKIGIEKLYIANQGAVKSLFHFSFAEYSDKNNMGYGYLRVMNDDIVTPGTGFPLHPHKDMEIISFVVKGELTHGDSMGNKEILKRGDIQYMSAGKGVYHSEYNNGKEELRFIQMWIIPDKKGYEPEYGSKKFKAEDRKNKFLKIVSGKSEENSIKVNQNVEIYISEIDKGKRVKKESLINSKLYLKVIEGEIKINNETVNEKESIKIEGEKELDITAEKESLILMVVSY